MKAGGGGEGVPEQVWGVRAREKLKIRSRSSE